MQDLLHFNPLKKPKTFLKFLKHIGVLAELNLNLVFFLFFFFTINFLFIVGCLLNANSRLIIPVGEMAKVRKNEHGFFFTFASLYLIHLY